MNGLFSLHFSAPTLRVVGPATVKLCRTADRPSRGYAVGNRC